MTGTIEQFPIENEELAKVNGEARHMRKIEAGVCPSCDVPVSEGMVMENQGFCSDTCLQNHINAFGEPIRSFSEYRELVDMCLDNDESFETTLREENRALSVELEFESEAGLMEKLRDGICPNEAKHGSCRFVVEDEYSHEGFCGEDCYHSYSSTHSFLKSAEIYRAYIKYAEENGLSFAKVLSGGNSENEEEIAA